MPVVPRNNISEPERVRRPDVSVAKPRMAEAMGAVASALGGRAAGYGRLAGVFEQGKDDAQRHGNRMMAIEAASGSANVRKFEAVGQLGGSLMQTGAMLDRIQERKNQEQAENAVTEYTGFLNRTTAGTVDQRTGERIPGTLETPYSPGNEKDKPSGPSISTAKSIKEWMEDENGAYAKLSPAAREEFDRQSARITQSVLDRAMRSEYDQIQTFRQANAKAAFESDRQLLQNQGSDISPGGDSAWMTDMMAARDAQVMREVGQYQKDPANKSLTNAEWENPEVASYAKESERALMETFTSDRVAVLLSAAQAEPDDARREALLAKAEDVAEMTYRDQPILEKLARDKTKLDADKIRIQASAMKANSLKVAIDRANDLKAQVILTGDQKAAQELDGLLQTLPPHVAVEVRQTQEAAHYQREMAMIEDARNDWLSVIGTPQEDAVKAKMILVAQGMTNERSRLRAPAFIQSAETTKATAVQAARADDIEKAVWLGGRKGPDGSFISMTDAELVTEVAKADIPHQKARDLMDQIAERKDRDPVVEKKIYAALDQIVGVDADASFKLADGMFEYETRTQDGKTVPVTEAESTLAEITVDERRFLPDRTVKLKAELIRNVAQDAYDYYRQQKTLSKDGKEPMSIEAYVRSRLMPDENEDARAWTEADIDLRIKQGQKERDDMRLLFLEQMSNPNEPASNE